MPRPKKCRRVCHEPSFGSFSPDGIKAEENISLSVDEYEVLRLLDFEGMTQEKCAAQMQVARTTVTQMYNEARFKLADAVVNGKQLIIEGGNYNLCTQRVKCGGLKNCRCKGVFKENNKIKSKENGQMKIAVTYENGEIFQHFGHTESFKLYDVEDGKVVSEQVTDTNGQGHGALAGFLLRNKADVLICGGIGGGAQNALSDAGIKLYGGVSGNADKAVAAFLAGNLEYNPDEKCSHHEHEEGHTCGDHGCGSKSHGCEGGSCH